MDKIKDIIKKHYQDFLDECVSKQAIIICKNEKPITLEITDELYCSLHFDGYIIIKNGDDEPYNEIYNKYFKHPIIQDTKKLTDNQIRHISKFGPFPFLCGIYVTAKILVDFTTLTFKKNVPSKSNFVFSTKPINYGDSFLEILEPSMTIFDKIALTDGVVENQPIITSYFILNTPYKELHKYITEFKNTPNLYSQEITVIGTPEELEFCEKILSKDKGYFMDYEFEAMCKNENKFSNYFKKML